MRTKLGDQTEPTLPVLEENEIFAEQPHALCPFVRHFHCSGDRLPVAPQQITGWRSRSNACQHVVLLGSQHGSFPFAILSRRIATRHRFAAVNRAMSPNRVLQTGCKSSTWILPNSNLTKLHLIVQDIERLAAIIKSDR